MFSLGTPIAFEPLKLGFIRMCTLEKMWCEKEQKWWGTVRRPLPIGTKGSNIWTSLKTSLSMTSWMTVPSEFCFYIFSLPFLPSCCLWLLLQVLFSLKISHFSWVVDVLEVFAQMLTSKTEPSCLRAFCLTHSPETTMFSPGTRDTLSCAKEWHGNTLQKWRKRYDLP